MGRPLFAPRRHEQHRAQYANGVSSRVIFGLPTATCVVGSLDAHDCLTSQAALDHTSAFINDTWSVGRTTMNLGVRWDRYNGWQPEQDSIGATVGRALGAARPSTRPSSTWNLFAPRAGVVFDLSGDGKTVSRQLRPLLAQPGRRRLAERQPEHRQQVGDLRLERPGRLRGLHQRRQALAARRRSGGATSQALQGAIRLNPDIKARSRMKPASGSSVSSPRRWAFAPASSTRPKTI